jgi:DNA-nicking Smr family endonuclease
VKKRLPTAEERRIWRESNRFTIKTTPPEGDDEAEAMDALAAEIDPPAISKTTVKKHKREVALPPVAPLTTRAAGRQLKSRGPVMATLDLHGLSKIEAYGRTNDFIHKHYALGHRHVLIITGKGRVGEGVLRRAVPEWLNELDMRRMVAGMAVASPEKGGEGALHVLLKKMP